MYVYIIYIYIYMCVCIGRIEKLMPLRPWGEVNNICLLGSGTRQRLSRGDKPVLNRHPVRIVCRKSVLLNVFILCSTKYLNKILQQNIFCWTKHWFVQHKNRLSLVSTKVFHIELIPWTRHPGSRCQAYPGEHSGILTHEAARRPAARREPPLHPHLTHRQQDAKLLTARDRAKLRELPTGSQGRSTGSPCPRDVCRGEQDHKVWAVPCTSAATGERRER